MKLIYIDPPFNTGQTFADYSDSLEHSIWLSMIRERFLLFKELLAPDGTLWVHLDDTEVHRARCLLDEIFGPSSYLATVVWQRTSAKSLARRTMGTMHESILVYGATEQSELRTIYLPLEEDYLKRYSQKDERGRYDTGDLTAGSHRPHLDSGLPWRGYDPSSIRRCWAVPRNPLIEAGLTDEQMAKMTMREKLDALDDVGYIHWPKKEGGFPRFKKYIHNTKGRAVGNLWTDINVINSQAVERTGFSTQKPEALIERILTMGSDPGDIVLDCFAGSGTTAAVAHKMRRRWVTVEALAETADQVTRSRLERVVAGDDIGGVTKSVGWEGGSGFRSLQVAPSALEVADDRVFLAEWVKADDLAAMAAAQLGFTYSGMKSNSPFCGKRGRALLAVVDGVVDEVVARGVLGQLDEGERVVLVGRGVTPEAVNLVSELSPGSKVLKAPRDLVHRGRAVR
ncbi:site-specific DNA-methyltransferase [Streptomyces xanthophaeus]|uniref:site-specific DNA-methyltransferase n=1 Tax=Streptomyces xanthophaeus TaxID=67385 RepID=UPI003719FE6F